MFPLHLPRPSAGLRARPRLEYLEDRSVPATFNVTTNLDVIDSGDGKRSLREAITAANNLAGADVIIVPGGVFKLALAGVGEDGNAAGDLDITDDVTIRGAGRDLTFIDGQQLDRVFDVFGNAPGSFKVVLERTTVRHGAAPGAGGGIKAANANLVVRDAAVTGNRATSVGGGIGCTTGTPEVKVVRTVVARNTALGVGGGILTPLGSILTVRDSTVRRNIATASGGGINVPTAILTNSTVSGNRAGVQGGGIWAGSAVTLTNSTVSGNTASDVGGGIHSNESVTLTNSTVSGNSASGSGGGISASVEANVIGSTISGNSALNNGGGMFGEAALLRRSTVSGNSASGSGGGIATDTATLTNSTVSGNRAAFDGGGIDADTATLTNSTISGNTTGTNGGGIWAITATLLNCTVTENLALIGGGLFHEPGGTFSVKNTIVALNLVLPGGSNSDVLGIFASQGHNLIGVGGGIGFVNGVNGDLVGTFLNPIDPKLGPLANNGGRTKTHALLAGSPAIDRGDNAGVPATDQRGFGFPRKKDGNGDGVARVDIGAFEK